MGGICHKLGQYVKAIELSHSAYALSQKAGDEHGCAGHLSAIGSSHRQLGELEQAWAHLTRALARSERIKDRLGVVTTMENLGNVCRGLERYDEAVMHLESALQMSREAGYQKAISTCLVDLAIVTFCKCEVKGASQAPPAALTGRAVSYLMEALEVAETTGEKPLIAAACSNVGRAFLLTFKDAAAAVPYLERASTIDNSLWAGLATDHERISFGSTSGHVVTARLLQKAYVDLGRHEEALVSAEFSRARSLEILMTRQRATSASAPAKAGSLALTIDAIRDVTASQGVAIVFFSQLTPVSLLVWVVSTTGVLTCRESRMNHNRRSITDLVEFTRRGIGASARSSFTPSHFPDDACNDRVLAPLSDDEDDASPPAELRDTLPEATITELLSQCYDLLIRPIATALQGSSDLLIIPDADLYALPFVALLDSASGKHLIERHTIRLAPSIGTLLLGSTASVTTHALVVGGPDYSGWVHSGTGKSLNQLPGATEEAHAIEKQLGTKFEDKVVLKCGPGATKDAAKEYMPSSEYIHFATHGSAHGIFLAGSSEADGTLTMADVAEMRLGARLVVLSACDSFRGELSADGLIGISRSFIAAGARAVIASLWKINDAATCVFMEQFYEHLLTGGCSTVKALQLTIIGLRGLKFDVLQWAAFNVFGSDS
eukprot:6332760-Prymnesium_polylepis.1